MNGSDSRSFISSGVGAALGRETGGRSMPAGTTVGKFRAISSYPDIQEMLSILTINKILKFFELLT